jgi:predicted transposase YbfD/YdcC
MAGCKNELLWEGQQHLVKKWNTVHTNHTCNVKASLSKFLEWKHPVYDHSTFSAARKNHPALKILARVSLYTCFSLTEFVWVTIKVF